MRGLRAVRLLVVGLLVGILAISLANVAKANAQQDDRLSIAISLPDLQSPAFVHVLAVVEAEANRRNIELIRLDGRNDSATQEAGLDLAVGQRVDGVVIWPIDADALAPAIQAAIDAGIPVVTVDRNVTGATTLAHVGADNVRGGEKQGEYLMQILPDGGKIIELQGSVGASPAIDRDAGFKKALEGHPEYEIVFDQTADFGRDEGLTVTEQALQANSEVDAIVAANDDMAFGAAEAVAGAGLEIPIIGFDALPEALQAVRDGSLAATVEQWPGRQTSGAMQILIDFVRNGTSPAAHDTFIEPTLITADNLGEAERAAEAGITPSATPVASPAAMTALRLFALQPSSAILRRD